RPVVARPGRAGPSLAELAAPRGFEPRFTDPKSAVLPLDEGAADPRGGPPSGADAGGQRNGAEDGTRTRDPHLGKVMLYQLSHFRVSSGGFSPNERIIASARLRFGREGSTQ